MDGPWGNAEQILSVGLLNLNYKLLHEDYDHATRRGQAAYVARLLYLGYML